MAYPTTRSMNADLVEGMTDGKFKKVVQNRGQAERTTYQDRKALSDVYYGIHEVPVKTLPDGRTVRTPGFIPTPAVQGFYVAS